MNKQIKVGVGVLIIKDNKVLLGHRKNNYKDTGGIHEDDTWTCPGGKQEFDETIIDCAIRETKEETNLDINDLTIFNAEDDISEDRHFVTIHVVAKNVTGNLKVQEADKIDEWKWFELNNLPNKIYSPSEKEIKAYKEKYK